MENRPVPPEELLQGIRDVDVILTEGYKHGPWKKIGVYRAASGSALPVISDSYIAVVTDAETDVPAPHIGLDDVKSLADFIVSDMQRPAGRLQGHPLLHDSGSGGRGAQDSNH